MSKKHLIVIGCFAAAFGLMSYLGWAMLIRPVDKEIKAKLAEKDDVEKKLVDAKSKAAQYDKFRAQAENIRQDLGLISSRLDSNFSVREERHLINWVMASSTMHVLTMAEVGKREASKTPGFGTLDEIAYVVTGSGGYHAFGELLNALNEKKQIFVPSSFTFTGAATPGRLDTDPFGFTFNFSIFLDRPGAPK